MKKSRAPADPEAETEAGLPALADPPDAAQIEQWRAQAAKADEYYQRFLLEAANLENYRKRATREKQEALTFANEALLQKLIPVLDSFEMANAAAQSAAAPAAMKAGVQMIFGQLKSVLTEAGLEEIDATGKKFDPNLHEAVSELVTADVPEGHVAQQARRGYRFRNRLIRPAGVIVAKKPH